MPKNTLKDYQDWTADAIISDLSERASDEPLAIRNLIVLCWQIAFMRGENSIKETK